MQVFLEASEALAAVVLLDLAFVGWLIQRARRRVNDHQHDAAVRPLPRQGRRV
jgi:hypothetical protein